MLQFKRDRKFRKQAELLELQEKVSHAFRTIDKLEKGNDSFATSISIFLGLIGGALIYGAIFCFLRDRILLFSIQSVLGFGFCALPYFVHERITRRKKAGNEQLIDEQYDLISEVCGRARTLWV
ncbi:hypothetical protein K7I13_10300 [Brucepastera parasyntrophica]|uniref:hypothetical protein n=1 Tax=Brucepastera parasyntrophica TaxID=2880008 RepID=UPI00210A2B84|nr:hypothetical protein [Brucepastera parasyntrophica]ULQ58913.1 hypothetical protein K7I13_10300 [Brucepastera parasyntrophica]